MADWQRWVPIFKVTDAHHSCAFYCDMLGFEKDWEHRFANDFPLYISVSRDSLTLHLSEHGDEPRQSDVFVAVDDVDQVYATLTERGLVAHGPPGDRPYGVRDFAFNDPDGNHLTLGTTLADFETAPGRTYDDK